MLRFAALMTLPLALGCSSDGLVSAPFIDAGVFSPDAEAVDAASAPEAATPSTTTFVRLAQLSPDVGPVDFCIKTKLEQFGPLLPASADGGAASLRFGDVSSYVSVPTYGTVDVSIVAAPATDCSSARAVGTFTLDAAKRSTIVVMGVAKGAVSPARSLGLAAFVDERPADSTSAGVRVIHAALGSALAPDLGPLVAGLTVGNGVSPLAAEVLPRKASSPSSQSPVVDSLGYHWLTPAPKGEVSLRLAYGSDAGVAVWTCKPQDLGLVAGTSHTAFVTSLPASSGGTIGVLVCEDILASQASACVWTTAY